MPTPGNEALRRSEEKFRRLHEARIDAFVGVDLDGRIEEFNDLFLQMVGYTADELRAMRYQDLTPDRWHDIENAIVTQQVLTRGHSDVYEKEYRHKDGTVFPVELRGILVRDPSTGQPVGMWAVVRDITARKRAEQELIASREALADSQESLLALINSTSDLIWSVDAQTFGLITCNDAMRAYFARRGAELRTGIKAEELLPPEVAAKWIEFYARAVREGPFVVQYTPTTRVPVLLLSISPVRRDGHVSAIAVFGKDITDRIEVEQALRASEQRFRQIAETVSDFVWEVDPEGLYTYTNPAVEKILGYRSEELVGRKHFYDLFADDVREEMTRLALAAHAEKQAFRHIPTMSVRKDGRIVRLEATGAPMLDAAGHLLGFRGATSDVTERWQNEQALRDLTGRLINAREAERARLAGELHDGVSQQLSLLAISLDVLANAPPAETGALRDALRAIKHDVDLLASDVHRMSHALHPARLEQLGLAGAIRGLCHDLAEAHSLAIHYEPRELPLEVPPAVALCVYRVAQEALENVIRHSDATQAIVDVVVDGDAVRLAVSDDGCGFDVGAALSGESLGLADMRERVRSIGGRFEVSSAPGLGTRIDVQAPLGAVKAT